MGSLSTMPSQSSSIPLQTSGLVPEPVQVSLPSWQMRWPDPHDPPSVPPHMSPTPGNSWGPAPSGSSSMKPSQSLSIPSQISALGLVPPTHMIVLVVGSPSVCATQDNLPGEQAPPLLPQA